MTTVDNKEEQINNAWDYLYNEWLAESMYQIDDRDYFEQYHWKEQKIRSLSLHLPICPKNQFPVYTIIKNPKLTFLVATKSGSQAEMKSSQAILQYLSQEYPNLIKWLNVFYIKMEGDHFTSGVKIPADKVDITSHDITKQEIEPGNYLVLNMHGITDYATCVHNLEMFSNMNRIQIDSKSIFALYRTNEAFQKPQMECYARVIMKQNDNNNMF